MINILKQILKKILLIQVINLPVRKLLKLKPIASIVPKQYLDIIPVSGVIGFQLPNGKKIYFNADGNDLIVRELYWQGIDKFEGGTIQLFIKLLKNTHTFLDIGANTGLYSIIAALNSCDTQVYAFEPVPNILPYLKSNAQLNKVDNLQICSSAVTNYNGEITIYIPPDAIPTSASTQQGFREASKEISVPAVTVDSFTTINGISKVDLMKIDTETTEHIVLEGAKKILERDKPVIICEVLNIQTEKYLQNILERFDYKYFWISKEGLIEKEKIEGDKTCKALNYLFIPKLKIQEVMSYMV